MDNHITVNRNTKALPISSGHSFTAEAVPVADERRQAISRLIVAAHAAYGTQAPQDEAMGVAVEVWKDALDESGVPTERLREMLKKCLSGRGSNYPPGVSEICGAWRAHLASLPAVTIQETDAQKRRALPQGDNSVFERGRELQTQMRARFKADKGNVQCDCGWPAALSADRFDWICDGKHERCGFRWSVADTFNAPIGKGKSGPMGGAMAEATPAPMPRESEPAEPEYSDSELIEQLAARCDFNAEKIGAEKSLAFALHLKKIVPVSVWSSALARTQWAAFSARQTAVLA